MSALPVARSDQVGYAFLSCPEPRLAEVATSSGPAGNVPSAGASLRPSFWSIAKLELSRACTREGPSPRHRGMPSPEEYRQRTKEARNQANACRNEWERQGLLIIADHYERLAAYKSLTALTAPAKANLKETATPRPPLKPNKKQAPVILGAKP